MDKEKKKVRPTNPFIIGPPVSAPKFIGRKEQVDTILSQLVNPESRGSSAISGKQRIGKTSLLHYITGRGAEMRYLPPDKFIFVSADSSTLGTYMNSLGLKTFTEDVFWRYIAQFLIYRTQRASPLIQLRSRILGFKHLAKVLGRSARLVKQNKIGVFELFELSEQIAADGKLAVLLLDEFEWVIEHTDPQHPSLLNTLRSLLNLPIDRRGFALITSSEKSLSVLCRDIKFSGSPFPNILVPVHLRPFSTTEAYDLIDEYLKDIGVAFTDKDKSFAYDLSEGHPYWLQRVCFEMFNRHLEETEADSVQGTQITMVLDALDYEEIMTDIMAERGRDSTSYTSIGERETQPTPRVVKEFFRSAGFDVKKTSEKTYGVKSSQPVWAEWGELFAHCFEEGDVRGDDVRKVANKTALKDIGEENLAFIVHSGRLIEGAARQLWEYKTEQKLVIIPVHVATLREQLVDSGRNPDACSEALLRLEEKWSTLGDPYQSVDSRTDPQWFFGSKRRMATEEMLQQIDEGVKAALIYGMRLVGKSAFLNQIYRGCRSRGYLTAKWVSKIYGGPCHEILNDIKQELTLSLKELYPGISVPDLSVFTQRYDANTFAAFKQDLLQLAKALDRHTGKAAKIVILLDEVDWIFPRQGSSDEEYMRYCNLFQTLKEVLEMPDRPGLLSLVVAMESPLIDQVNVFPHNERFQNPMFRRFKVLKRLLFMEREDMDEMIQTLGQLRGLEYSRGSLDRIFEQTRGHVALARRLCSCIVSLREREKLTGSVRTEEVVEAEESLLVEESVYFLKVLWDNPWSHNLKAEQLVLLKLASSPTCSETNLEQELLRKDDSTQVRQRIYYALNRLKDLGLIEEDEKENELHYRLTIPIYQRWIRDYLPDVKKPGGWQ